MPMVVVSGWREREGGISFGLLLEGNFFHFAEWLFLFTIVYLFREIEDICFCVQVQGRR